MVVSEYWSSCIAVLCQCNFIQYTSIYYWKLDCIGISPDTRYQTSLADDARSYATIDTISLFLDCAVS